MDEELELRVNDNNEVVSVEKIEQEVPISSTELQRQIDEHLAIVESLKGKLAIVLQFEEDNSEVITSEPIN